MTDFFRAFQQHLSQLNLPVWMENEAPTNTRFPYVAWSMEHGLSDRASSATVTCWYRHDHAECIRTLERIRALFPQEGVLLHFPGGLAACYADTCTIVHDPHDKALEGGRLRLEIHAYEHPANKEVML